ncbi:hypothetical protein [[Kitasatospora] papulosa]|uniref:hypothetical protein n=1 Tax=[Kitasatospora] papulosa TaxID=1464011 RepID=UPI003697391F
MNPTVSPSSRAAVAPAGSAGLLVAAGDGTAVLADDVRYRLRLPDADDLSTY